MSKREMIEEFLGKKSFAFYGTSRSGKKFGNLAYKELRKRGYRLYPVHPEVEEVEGDRAYGSLEAIQAPIDGAVLVVPPEQTERIVRELATKGIRRVWMQQGAESKEAVAFCQENGLDVVHGECILMFAQPVASIHRFHRWLWKLLGKLPQ